MADPLPRRMIGDLTVHNLSQATQRSYIHAVSKFSRVFWLFPRSSGAGGCPGLSGVFGFERDFLGFAQRDRLRPVYGGSRKERQFLSGSYPGAAAAKRVALMFVQPVPEEWICPP